MNFKTTYLLFGILGALILVFFVVLFTGTSGKPESDYLFPDANGKAATLQPDQVDRLEIARSRPTQANIAFERGADKQWRITQPPGLRADSQVVESMVGSILHLHRTQQDKPSETRDLKQRELDPPAAVVTFQADSKKYTLNLGAELPGTTSAVVYVNSSEHKEPVAVPRSSVDQLYKNVNDFRSRILLADNSTDISSLKLQQGTNKPVALEKKGETRWVIQEPPYGEADMGLGASTGFGQPPSPGGGVRGLLTAVTGLKVDSPADFVTDNASDKDLADKKLDPASAEYSIEIRRGAPGTKDAPTATLLIGKPVDDKNQQRFARLKEDKNIVKIAATTLEPIKKVLERPSDLRDRRLVRLDLTQPDAINITGDKGTVRLRDQKSSDGWMLYRGTPPAQGEATDRNAVNQLVSELERARIVDFPEVETKIEKPAVVVTCWVGGLVPPPKKEPGKEDRTEPTIKEPNKPSVELAFAKPEGDRVTVRRTVLDGDKQQTSTVIVPRAVFESFNVGPLDLLRREIPPFTTEMADIAKDVTRLVLVHHGETFELVKETKDNVTTWKFDEPTDLKGQAASKSMVETILRRLNTGIRILRLAAEKPTEEELDKKYGLKFLKNRAQVVLTRDGKTETIDYFIGNDAEDRQAVYARMSKGDVVFVVGKEIVDALALELQDTHLWTLTASKITSLKFLGWKKQNVTPYTLELEQQSPGTWLAKVPADFPVNSNQVNTFVDRTLANLTAIRFVRKDGPAANDKMFQINDADNSLEIEIRLQGEAPRKLTIGAAAGMDGFYAKIEPGNRMFVLTRLPWEELLAGQKYFAKP